MNFFQFFLSCIHTQAINDYSGLWNVGFETVKNPERLIEMEPETTV